MSVLDDMTADAAGDAVLTAMVARAAARVAERVDVVEQAGGDGDAARTAAEAAEAALWERLRLGTENPRLIYRTRAEIEAEAVSFPPLRGLAQRQLDHLDAGTKTVAEACAFWTEVRAAHLEIA